jgi:hypothetical protein
VYEKMKGDESLFRGCDASLRLAIVTMPRRLEERRRRRRRGSRVEFLFYQAGR